MSDNRLLTDEELILDICADCSGEDYLRDMDCKACHRNMLSIARLVREQTALEIFEAVDGFLGIFEGDGGFVDICNHVAFSAYEDMKTRCLPKEEKK